MVYFINNYLFVHRYSCTFLIINVEFVPPNPKEFDKNTSIFLSKVCLMRFNLAASPSGFSKLIFGATKECCIINMEYTISLAPAIQHSCPVMDLVELTQGPLSPKMAYMALASLASPTGVEVAWAFT